MTKAIALMVPKQRPSSERGMSGTLFSSRIWSWRQSHSSSLPMDSYLLSSTAFLSDLVEEGYRLPNVGFDVLGKFAFVAENLCGVHTSDYEREAFLLIPGLKNSQLGSSNDVYY